MIFRATLRRGGADEERSLVVRFKRDGKVISLMVAGDRRVYGVNLHRHAGLSLSGLPQHGGTSLLWGRLGHRVAALSEDTRWQRQVGPLIATAGRDF